MENELTGRLQNKVAVVTGGGNGIGRAIALRYASEGAKVAVVDIDLDGAERAVAAIKQAGGEAFASQTDISQEDAVAALYEQVLAQYGRLDVVVNNAGIVSPMRHVLEADLAWWDRIISVNLTGTFICCRLAAHIMAKQGSGVLINMSSGGATRAHRAFVAYDATKGGIEAMTRALALDLGPYGIRVNILTPGSIDTSNLGEEERKARGVNYPLGRIGDVEDMTGAAVFLASDDSIYMTGQNIVIDGGLLAQQRSATVDIYPPEKFPAVD